MDSPEKQILEIPISQQTQLLALVACIRMATRMAIFKVSMPSKQAIHAANLSEADGSIAPLSIQALHPIKCQEENEEIYLPTRFLIA
ncbi:MAG: hypothetical protein OEV35_00415 [Gallionellaceae bacterium]|nr:hypothetical protein [Gallionellaceae bacterium]